MNNNLELGHENNTITEDQEKAPTEKLAKNKVTLFLERNEIWFKTILSLLVSVAALFVSIASFKTTRYESDLSAANAERERREKMPFFSVEQYYDADRGQYIYGITNTGGQVRQFHIGISPYIVITQSKRTDSVVNPLNKAVINDSEIVAYIYLPGFYVPEEVTSFDGGIFAFSDVWIDETISRIFPEVGLIGIEYEIAPELADNYFSDLVSVNNVDSVNTYLSSQIDYYVEISYYDYSNKHVTEHLWLTRGDDATSRALNLKGNPILLYSRGLDQQHYEDLSNIGHSYTVDSLNLPLDDVVKNVKEIFAALFEDVHQVS